MLPRLELHTVNVGLQARSERARCSPSKLEANLQINQKFETLKMEITDPSIDIDQKESFASAGLRTSLDMVKAFNQKGMQEGMADIARIVSEGLQCLRFENGENAFRNISRQKGLSHGQLDVRFVTPPKITATRGEVRCSVDGDTLEMSCKPIRSEGSYSPANLEITLTPIRPELNISVVPGQPYEPLLL